MIRQQIVRGYNEKVFYAVTQGEIDKIMMISFNTGKKETKQDKVNYKTLNQTEVFNLREGRLIQFENDNEHV